MRTGGEVTPCRLRPADRLSRGIRVVVRGVVNASHTFPRPADRSAVLKGQERADVPALFPKNRDQESTVVFNRH